MTPDHATPADRVPDPVTADRADVLAAAAAVATGAVSVDTRPETLARILEGLRGLPPREPASDRAGDGHGDPAVPLPRRR